MRKPIQDQTPEQDDELDPYEDIEEGDYGFIVGADGELKHLFTPSGFELDPPQTVRRMLKIFGIKDINAHDVDGDILH